MDVLQQGDIGAQIIFEIREDGGLINVTAATSITVYLVPPDGVVKSFVGSVLDGPNGRLRYVTTLASDLDEAGVWRGQVGFTLAGWVGRSSFQRFRVAANA